MKTLKTRNPKLPSFGNMPPELTRADTAKAVVVPVPLEKTTTYLKGTGRGPAAILEASTHMEFYDEALDRQTVRVGIHTDKAVDCSGPLKTCVENTRKRALHWFDKGLFPVFLGGEHSISVGVFQALREIHGPVTIFQIDAHADLRESYHGTPLNHACIMARAHDEGHTLVQVGIRSLTRVEAAKIRSSRNIHTFFDHDRSWRRPGYASIAKRLKGKVYVTVDVDGLSPTLMPATGTPEPGGLDWHETMALLDMVYSRSEVVGADVNELMPRPGLESCDFLCSRLVYRLIGLKARQARWPHRQADLGTDD